MASLIEIDGKTSNKPTDSRHIESSGSPTRQYACSLSQSLLHPRYSLSPPEYYSPEAHFESHLAIPEVASFWQYIQKQSPREQQYALEKASVGDASRWSKSLHTNASDVSGRSRGSIPSPHARTEAGHTERPLLTPQLDDPGRQDPDPPQPVRRATSTNQSASRLKKNLVDHQSPTKRILNKLGMHSNFSNPNTSSMKDTHGSPTALSGVPSKAAKVLGTESVQHKALPHIPFSTTYRCFERSSDPNQDFAGDCPHQNDVNKDEMTETLSWGALPKEHVKSYLNSAHDRSARTALGHPSANLRYYEDEPPPTPPSKPSRSKTNSVNITNHHFQHDVPSRGQSGRDHDKSNMDCSKWSPQTPIVDLKTFQHCLNVETDNTDVRSFHGIIENEENNGLQSSALNIRSGLSPSRRPRFTSRRQNVPRIEHPSNLDVAYGPSSKSSALSPMNVKQFCPQPLAIPSRTHQPTAILHDGAEVRELSLSSTSASVPFCLDEGYQTYTSPRVVSGSRPSSPLSNSNIETPRADINLQQHMALLNRNLAELTAVLEISHVAQTEQTNRLEDVLATIRDELTDLGNAMCNVQSTIQTAIDPPFKRPHATWPSTGRVGYARVSDVAEVHAAGTSAAPGPSPMHTYFDSLGTKSS